MTTLLAHGLGGRADLPIPQWLFGWVAAIVLVISFVSLGALWRRPVLEHARRRALPIWFSRAVTHPVTEGVCGTIGVALLGLVFWAGFAGEQNTVQNIVPTLVYVAFWVGLAFVSVLFGDVFRAFNPWRAIGRAVAFVFGRLLGERIGSGMPYPQRLGYWPAVAGLVAFAWLELLAPDGTEPRAIAAAALAYSCLTFLGMGIFGIEEWTRRGEAFSVYFGLFARISVWERRERDVYLRPPLTGLAVLRPDVTLVPLVAVMIGTVTFDGLQESAFWADVGGAIEDGFDSFMSSGLADQLAGGVGMLLCIAAIAGFYLLGVAGARTAGTTYSTADLAAAFAPSLVPIAFVYVAAHYLTFMLFQGQALIPLSSDPLGRGWDLFGTADTVIDYALIGATVTWYCQVAFVVAGHCAGLVLAHDKALTIFEDPRAAQRSQYWMLAVMIGFTSFALWLLSSANA